MLAINKNSLFLYTYSVKFTQIRLNTISSLFSLKEHLIKLFTIGRLNVAERLNEWASGKAGYVANRVYALLQKYTGIKFEICPSFWAYKNKWGLFFGRLALASNGRFYRLNFTRGSTDEVVSMDVWNKGQDASEKLPAYTCSFEGYGISKVISMLKDFVLTPDKVLTEGLARNEESAFANILYEDSQELKTFISAFLQENPAWQQNWASGTVDDKQYFKTASQWIKQANVNGAKYSGNPVLTTIALMSNTKALIKLNPSIVGVSSPTQVKGIVTVPSVSVIKSSAAGVETLVDLSDVYDDKVTFDQIKAQLVNDQKGPLAQMSLMRETIVELIEDGEYGDVMMAVIWGRGGIGKTYTFEETMDSMGLSKGEHWMVLDKRIATASEGGLQAWLIVNADKDIILIDDNDSMFKTKFINTWKNALNPNVKGRTLDVSYLPGHKLQGDEPAAGEYPIKFKVVWLSNYNPKTTIEDSSGAMSRRYISLEYNFTDVEVMAIVADHFESLYPQFNDTVTPEEKARIFYLFWKASQKRQSKNIKVTDLVSFGQFDAALKKWFLKKARGVNFDTFAKTYLSSVLNVTL
jgi:hypothetical protein